MNDFFGLDQMTFLMYVAYYALISVGFVYLVFIRHRGHVLVRVKTPLSEWDAWRKPEPDGCTLVMNKDTDKKAGWTIKFTNEAVQHKTAWFGFKHFRVLDVFHAAEKAVSWDFKQKEADQPKLTKQQVKEYARADILKQRGSKIKSPTSIITYAILVLVIIVLVLQFVQKAGIIIG